MLESRSAWQLSWQIWINRIPCEPTPVMPLGYLIAREFPMRTPGGERGGPPIV